MSFGQCLVYYHLGKAYLGKCDKLSALKYLQKLVGPTINFKGRQDAERFLLSLKCTYKTLDIPQLPLRLCHLSLDKSGSGIDFLKIINHTFISYLLK